MGQHFIAMNAYIREKKKKRKLIHNLTFHLKKPEEQMKPQVSRRKEIMKTGVDINKIETEKQQNQ